MKIDEYKRLLEENDMDSEQYNHFLDAKKKELELKGYSNSWLGKPQRIGIMVSLMAIIIPAGLSLVFRYLDHHKITEEVEDSRITLATLKDSLLEQQNKIVLAQEQWTKEKRQWTLERARHDSIVLQMTQEKEVLETEKQIASRTANQLSQFSKSVSEANMYFALSDWKQATEYFSKSIRSNPRCVVCYEQRGYAYFKISEAGEKSVQPKAANDFSTVIRLDPGRASSYYFRARLNMDIEQWAKAIEDFSRAINYRPMLKDAFARRAFCYQKIGNLEAAIQDLSTYCRIESDISKRSFKQKELDQLKAQLAKEDES